MSHSIPGNGLVSLCYSQEQALGHRPHCKNHSSCHINTLVLLDTLWFCSHWPCCRHIAKNVFAKRSASSKSSIHSTLFPCCLLVSCFLVNPHHYAQTDLDLVWVSNAGLCAAQPGFKLRSRPQNALDKSLHFTLHHFPLGKQVTTAQPCSPHIPSVFVESPQNSPCIPHGLCPWAMLAATS